MNERDIKEKIRESAEDLKIPEGLLPEQIEELLKQEKNQKGSFAGRTGRKRFYGAYAACAAVLLAVCSYALFATTQGGFAQPENALDMAMQKEASEQEAPEQEAPEQEAAQPEKSAEGAEGKASVTDASPDMAQGAAADNSTEDEQKRQEGKKKTDAGELYVVASDYDQVYDMIKEYAVSAVRGYGDMVFEAGIMEAPASYKEASSAEAFMQDGIGNTQMSSLGAQQGESMSGYSTTNLQTEGVDESDIIKTDGSYIYLVSNNKIYIIDIRNGEPQETACFTLPKGTEYSRIQELYVDNGYLIVIAEEWKTGLEKIYYPTEESVPNGSNVIPLEEGESEAGTQNADSGIGDVERRYYTITRYQTTSYTYSLKNKKAPQLIGSVGQDGSYYTSRKIGDKLYLFTQESLAVTGEDAQYGWIPLAGGERIAADCIYLPRQGGNGLIISSVDMNAPDKIQDNVMIVNQSVQIYVSTGAVYLYHSNYLNGTPVTEIAKFSLEDGYIDAAGAASVNGTVSDTFAVNEYQGMLRILTNVNYSTDGSSLYILDENMALTGSLEGVAPGESIYAARYLGDMAYFVTYRNMDPLFAVDLSDPAQPAVLGELEITGYSDYLHFWEDGIMLGIGYETDPDSGTRQGIKLAMFDISDPLNMKVLDSVCIANADYSPALDEYKTVLADAGENIIGFVVTEYNRGEDNTYLLFGWKDTKFQNILTESIESGARNFRGLYAGNYFYIVSPEKITAFDRSNAFEKLGSLELE